LILLGAVVLTGLVLATVGLFAVGSRQWFWNDAFYVRAGFHEIRGVEVGTRVRVQGIDAGEVIAIDPPAAPGGDVPAIHLSGEAQPQPQALVLILRTKGERV